MVLNILLAFLGSIERERGGKGRVEIQIVQLLPPSPFCSEGESNDAHIKKKSQMIKHMSLKNPNDF